MTIKMQNSYAKQYLKEKDLRIFRGNNQILNENIPNFIVKSFNTRIECDRPLISERSRITHIGYDDLIRLGYCIYPYRLKPSEKWSRGIRVKYLITKTSLGFEPIKFIPVDHYIEYDEVNRRIRLKGHNTGIFGVGKWVQLIPKFPQRAKIKDFSELKSEVIKILCPLNFKPEIKEYMDVPEIPLMIEHSGELICILPKLKESNVNPPVIVIVGARGSGKTLALHNISDCIYQKGLGYQFHLNDQLGTYDTWSRPQEFKFFLSEMLKIGHYPIYRPNIYLTLNTNEIGTVTHEKEGIGFRISLPFNDFVKNMKYYLEGLKNWELAKGSATRFREIMETIDLSEIKSRMDVIERMTSYFNAEKEEAMINHIKSKLNDIFNQEFLNITNGIDAKWLLIDKNNRKIQNYPHIISMIAGLTPILVTTNLIKKEFGPNILRWVIDTTFEHCINKKDGIWTWLFFDEIDDIIKRRERKSINVAAGSVIKVHTEGRTPNIATVSTTQTFSLPVDIETNITHLLIFRTNQTKVVSHIKNSYELPSKFVDDIKNLSKYEAILIAKEDVVVYSPDRKERRIESGEIYKGMIIPSMSMHRPPGYVG